MNSRPVYFLQLYGIHTIRAIITCSLYIYHPFLKTISLCSRWFFFQKILFLSMVSIQEVVMIVHIQYLLQVSLFCKYRSCVSWKDYHSKSQVPKSKWWGHSLYINSSEKLLPFSVFLWAPTTIIICKSVNDPVWIQASTDSRKWREIHRISFSRKIFVSFWAPQQCKQTLQFKFVVCYHQFSFLVDNKDLNKILNDQKCDNPNDENKDVRSESYVFLFHYFDYNSSLKSNE